MRLYRLLIWVLQPVLVARVLWQRLRGQVGPGALAERLGRGSVGGPGPVIWLHGASNGELASARWLLERLMAAVPGVAVIVTCNTASARRMVQGWALPGVSAALAPIDTPGALRRFVGRWQPRLLLIIENELWPERIVQAAARMPVVLLGARMSEGSARNWGRLAPGLMRGLLGRLAHVSAQDAGSEARLRALGLPGDRLGPPLVLKARAGVSAAGAPPFACPVPRARCLLAASTHAGEDAVLLAGFAQARSAGAVDLLILAPRHPQRGAAISGLIAAQGLGFATRSAGQVPGPGTAVYLADTLGEMAHWYGMAGACFIGGSLVDRGGHTPFEPAACGMALLHGPFTANFREAFARLDAAGAALAVSDADSLGAALTGLTPARQADLAARARALLAPEGDPEALIATLLRLGRLG
ncbi:glycosyltransferase N-terminal domain-containing protein [Paracoccaceae bacterium Fryx2]|nr:glycosyltransferase N-terminal domain-containing protein [Paracoccaceae bacterium Fryx2]